jgi:hypothetical protein
MSVNGGPNISENGLVLSLDAADKTSYPGTGTAWNNLVGSNNGVLTNGPTFSTDGKGCIVFDGVDDAVITSSINLSSTNKITITFWCRILNYREVQNGNQIIIEITNNFNSSDEGLYIGFGDDSNALFLSTFPISVNLRGNSGYNISGFNKNLVNDLKWHHWSCIFDKSITGITPQETFLYIDGLYQQPTIIPTSFRSNSTNNFGNQPLNIGCRNGGISPSNVQISNIGIYNRVLNADEVLQNYNNTKSRFGL